MKYLRRYFQAVARRDYCVGMATVGFLAVLLVATFLDVTPSWIRVFSGILAFIILLFLLLGMAA